ncbi:TPA: phage head closure protein [Photobacterium damselae]
MRAGKLRSRIILLHKVERQDSAGGVVGDWVPYATVRCEDIVMSSQSKLQYGMELDQEIHTIRVRYRSDISSKHRVQLPDGRILKIEGRPRPGKDQRNRELFITAIYQGT